jgi:hypothetical protein
MRARQKQIEHVSGGRVLPLKMQHLISPIVLHHLGQTPNQKIQKATDLQAEQGGQQDPQKRVGLKQFHASALVS